ncbi:MAG: tetratricopeptide repeat protein [Candidatus Jorgensenbacteria bacterium]
MNKTIKSTIVVLLAILAIAGIIFGAYAPLTKSTRYIKALKEISLVHSMNDFEKNFLPALTHWSPIGQEEVVKFLANDIVGIASQSGQPEVVARAVVDFVEPYLFKDDIRHLLIGASIRAILWQNYGRKEADFEKAEAYYRAALAIGPKLPPPLYGLLELYRQKGDVEKASAIIGQIISLWPDAFSER